jgi:hypothetical protein
MELLMSAKYDVSTVIQRQLINFYTILFYISNKSRPIVLQILFIIN